MKTTFSFVLFSVLFLTQPAFSQEPDGQLKPSQDHAAPLMIASDSGPKMQFQVGADAFGGMSDMDFVGGFNATFLYPIIDLLWVGLRPSLHYGMISDSPYDTIWMHADVITQINIIHDPVRLYVVTSGGYSFAADGDLYDKLAHGFSVMHGIGVAWHPADSSVGLFLETGFRYARASAETSQLVLDDRGKPVFDSVSFSYTTESYDRTFDLTSLFVNVGLAVSP